MKEQPNDHLPCTMGRDTERARNNRHDPENMVVAYAHQLHDCAVNMRSMGMAKSHGGTLNIIRQIRGFLDILERTGERTMFLSTKQKAKP